MIDYRKLLGVPVAQVSIVFITLILMFFDVLTDTQRFAMFLFVTIPIILEFMLWMTEKPRFSKFLHMPIFTFIIAYLIFLIANIYTKNITSLKTLAVTFYDFLVAFFFSFSSSVIVNIMITHFFPQVEGVRAGVREVKNKKIKVLITILAAVFIPLILVSFFNVSTKMLRLKLTGNETNTTGG